MPKLELGDLDAVKASKEANIPVLAKYASDGTLKMLAYLVLLNDPAPPAFIGIEEPENFLHPRLLPRLAEECRAATARSQLLVTTHSPGFLSTNSKSTWTPGLRPAACRAPGQKDNMQPSRGSVWPASMRR